MAKQGVPVYLFVDLERLERPEMDVPPPFLRIITLKILRVCLDFL